MTSLGLLKRTAECASLEAMAYRGPFTDCIVRGILEFLGMRDFTHLAAVGPELRGRMNSYRCQHERYAPRWSTGPPVTDSPRFRRTMSTAEWVALRELPTYWPGRAMPPSLVERFGAGPESYWRVGQHLYECARAFRSCNYVRREHLSCGHLPIWDCSLCSDVGQKLWMVWVQMNFFA